MLALVAWLLAGAAPAPAHASPAAVTRARAREARTLYRHALGRLERGDIDNRRIAIQDLERAETLDPTEPLYPMALGGAYERAGFVHGARGAYARALDLRPRDVEARLGVARTWRHDWLKYLDTLSLARAVDNLSLAARIEPGRPEPWIALAPLLLEQHRLGAAAAAADRALEAAPSRPEAQLAAAMTSYRRGDVARAERLFDLALPRLPPDVRARFDDISPVASERDTFVLHRLPEDRQAEFVRRFWKEHDPDPATPENEALLEYRARVTQAYFLFYDARRHEWDQRGEVYVRYGEPPIARYNPLDAPLSFSFGTGPPFPANALVWDYPDLGMRVLMQDRTLNEFYLPPVSLEHDTDPRPDPDSLAHLKGELATRDGRGVFPVLPPGVRPLPVHGAVARFETAAGTRLLAQLEAPAAPADTLTADWVVLDSTAHEVARARRRLSPSACDVVDSRVGEFATELPPGRYLVGISVRAPGHRRGVFRAPVVVAPPDSGLELSDLVVSCGAPFVAPAGAGAAPAVRLEPNPGARVAPGEPLTVYFEIYHLKPDAGGEARFEYVYTVSSDEHDSRIWIQRLFAPRPQPPPISASREERQPGPLRRQFVTVPVQDLPPGRYRMEVRVRDLVAGSEAARSVSFHKDAPAAARE